MKFIAYLEPRTAATGALRVVPGSHVREFGARIDGYLTGDPAAQGFDGWPFPGLALDTEPGDVIAFDVALLHSSSGGENRLAWTIEYLPWPGLGDRERMEVFQSPEIEESTPFDDIANRALADQVRDVLHTLKPIEADVLRRRFGLDNEREVTLQEIASEYGLSRERIRQIQEKALSKVRRGLKVDEPEAG